MSSAFEKHASPMDELLAIQQSALQANLNKASNIQNAVTLTEANWMGLTQAMELTGNSILKAQETLERLPTTQEMNTLLAGQAGNLTAAHTEAVQQIQKTVQALLETSRETLQWMQEEMQETRAASQRESEKLLKEFQLQAGKISETYSSRLSRAEDTLRESANSIRWKMYIPTIILVLWELVRHLWLQGCWRTPAMTRRSAAGRWRLVRPRRIWALSSAWPPEPSVQQPGSTGRIHPNRTSHR